MSAEEFPKKELETLWAPWRVEYFEKEPRDLNFLCAASSLACAAAERKFRSRGERMHFW